MIGYLEGALLKIEEDGIMLLVNQIGYEILLPTYVMHRIGTRQPGDQIALYIYHQQTERQPKPVLIGFDEEADKDFFRQFISVDDIGPLKAVKAMTIPVGDIAAAIEAKDTAALQNLKGIGHRTAQKIIASLSGKTSAYATAPSGPTEKEPVENEISQEVVKVLISQLGYKISEARRLVAEALTRKQNPATPEDLFDEIFRGPAQPKS